MRCHRTADTLGTTLRRVALAKGHFSPSLLQNELRKRLSSDMRLARRPGILPFLTNVTESMSGLIFASHSVFLYQEAYKSSLPRDGQIVKKLMFIRRP